MPPQDLLLLISGPYLRTRSPRSSAPEETGCRNAPIRTRQGPPAISFGVVHDVCCLLSTEPPAGGLASRLASAGRAAAAASGGSPDPFFGRGLQRWSATPATHLDRHPARNGRGVPDRRRDRRRVLGARVTPTCSARSTNSQDGWPPRGSGGATGSASASPPAPPTCTSRSWRCFPSVRPMCRSTWTIPTAGRNRCGRRPASARWSEAGRAVTPRAGAAASARGRNRRTHRTMRGSSSRPGSTGKPKGVAVCHRSAAAFVDAEARLFLQDEPLGPADRVLAGLSVAFDASCEEMWLAWRHGACLVPAPRSLVKAGADLGGWLVQRRITVVSTVPTLAALWSSEQLRRDPVVDPRRRSVSGRAGTPPGRGLPGGVEHLRSDRDDRGRVRRAIVRRTRRCASGCPSTGGSLPSLTRTAADPSSGVRSGNC